MSPTVCMSPLGPLIRVMVWPRQNPFDEVLANISLLHFDPLQCAAAAVTPFFYWENSILQRISCWAGRPPTSPPPLHPKMEHGRRQEGPHGAPTLRLLLTHADSSCFPTKSPQDFWHWKFVGPGVSRNLGACRAAWRWPQSKEGNGTMPVPVVSPGTLERESREIR